MKIKSLIWLCLVALAACGNPQVERAQQLNKHCIEVHDEVMPRLGEIASLKKELSTKRTTLAKDSTADEAALIEYRSLIQLLDSADEAMMSWMAQYDPDYLAEHKPEEAIAYYEDQEGKIEYVKTLMLKSIEDANETLEKNP